MLTGGSWRPPRKANVMQAVRIQVSNALLVFQAVPRIKRARNFMVLPASPNETRSLLHLMTFGLSGLHCSSLFIKPGIGPIF